RYLREFLPLKLLGEGAFGCVFKAENLLDEWKYAVKREGTDCRNVTDMSKALREVRVMAQFDHPGIVRYNCTWIERPTGEALNKKKLKTVKPISNDFQRPRVFHQTVYIYIQMQLCKYSLEHWLERNQEPRDLDRIMSWMLQILSAIDYMHDQGVIHRDLKPSNVLFVEADRLKICDLGIATESNERDCPTKQSFGSNSSIASACSERTFNLGTPMYMPREQMTWQYDEKVDIFSLGLIFAEMCCPMTPKDKGKV
ncbi:hypothetical protein PFISCL1PPCAC_7498, partial [Pristionchus fissidentatus]